MLRFAGFFLGLGLLTLGHPVADNLRPRIKRSVDVGEYRLETISKYVSSSETKLLNNSKDVSPNRDLVEIATTFVQEKFPAAVYRLSQDHYTGSSGILHIYFKQTVHDIDVDNSDINVNVRTKINLTI